MMVEMEGTALRFAEAARTLGEIARAHGWSMPAFRSPPRVAGAHRTVRRRQGAVTVAVRLRDRPWAAVVADMVEGVIVANRLGGAEAARARAALWAALDGRRAVAA
jgi:Ser/Thr protein kinase RdoA (MazF antagonist)